MWTCCELFDFDCLFTYLDWQALLKSLRCDIIDWHYDRGLNNSKLTVWSLITVVDGGMRVWHFNRVITTYEKRDCRNSWRYASLAVNRGAIKLGFTAFPKIVLKKSERGMPNYFQSIQGLCWVPTVVRYPWYNVWQ